MARTTMPHQFFWVSVASKRLVENRSQLLTRRRLGACLRFAAIHWPTPGCDENCSAGTRPEPTAREGGASEAGDKAGFSPGFSCASPHLLSSARRAARASVTRHGDSLSPSPEGPGHWSRSYLCASFSVSPPPRASAHARGSVSVWGMSELNECIHSHVPATASPAPSDWLGGKV